MSELQGDSGVCFASGIAGKTKRGKGELFSEYKGKRAEWTKSCEGFGVSEATLMLWKRHVYRGRRLRRRGLIVRRPYLPGKLKKKGSSFEGGAAGDNVRRGRGFANNVGTKLGNSWE